jgi:hypothetical protein
VHLDADDLHRYSRALADPEPHHALREEATLGDSPGLGPAYRWLVRGEPVPDEPVSLDRHAAHELADRFERAAADPASYLQVDDIWQAVRQRELVIRVLEIEEELGELSGLPAREPWQQVTELWRRLPPLLLHAQLLAGTGSRGHSADALVATFREIAERESELAANRFPAVTP